jgi:hypothetical protein
MIGTAKKQRVFMSGKRNKARDEDIIFSVAVGPTNIEGVR